MTAFTAFQSGPGNEGKRDFANYAPGFVNRFMKLPGARSLAIGSALGIATAVITGPFQTGHFPLGERILFWTLAIAAVAIAWRAWFAAYIRSPQDWTRATIFGGMAISASMPLVVVGALKIVGRDISPQWWVIWPKSLGLALVIGGALWIFARRRHAIPSVPSQGRLWRHGVTDPAELMRVEAEDHYLRLILRDGRSMLVYDRFSSILPELAALNGCLLRRGRWVAAANVASIERDGRRTMVKTNDQSIIQVSPSGRTAMRRLGWI